MLQVFVIESQNAITRVVAELSGQQTQHFELTNKQGYCLTSDAGVDASNSIIVDQKSRQSLQVWEVFQLHYLIVRQVNAVILILHQTTLHRFTW